MNTEIKRFKVLSWNCRGLGNLDKCNIVCDVIRKSRCDVCMLQETKWNGLDPNFYSRVLPTFFDRNCVAISAINSSGGCLISWKRNYELLSSWSTSHSCSALLRQSQTGIKVLFTNVYGPTEDAKKPGFLREIKEVYKLVQVPWVLGGDFNLVRWLIDRSGDMRGLSLMCSFNDVIRDIEMVDVELKNREYTYSSKRPQPSLSRLDRIFISTEISSQFPLVSLEALEMTVSDHSPLLLSCSKQQLSKKPCRLELFWLKNSASCEIIKKIWSSSMRQELIPDFNAKVSQTHSNLREWHCNNFSDLEKQLQQFCKKTILFFDRIEERRTLEDYEFRFKILVRERAFKLACISEIRWKQRSRCNWLANGDKNTRFFHAFASSRKHKNRVLKLIFEGAEITDPKQICCAFRLYMISLLGTENETLAFQPNALYIVDNELQNLDDCFTEIEISYAIKQLTRNKASGPDGIPNEFVQTFWQEMKELVVAMVQKFYSNNLELKGINRANLVMIPKKEVSEGVGDFRPISVINL